MKRLRKLFVFVGLVVLVAIGAVLAQGGSNDVSLASAIPSTGQISVSGSYTLASGYTLCGVTGRGRPSGDVAGEGGQNAVAAKNGDFSGTVTVPAGQFDVQITMQVKDASGTVSYYVSNVLTVTVP